MKKLLRNILIIIIIVILVSGVVYACVHDYSAVKYMSSTHTPGLGHQQYYKCRLCGYHNIIGYIYYSNCATCNPTHTCSYVWWISQTHTSSGHSAYQKCSGCTSTRYVGSYLPLSGCVLCYPPHSHSYTTYTSSTHNSSYNGHYKYNLCSCGSSYSLGYVSLSGCSICYPHVHSYTEYTSSTHDSTYDGHYKYNSCSCGSTVLLGYVSYSSCITCNPPLPTNQTEFEIYAINHGKLRFIPKFGVDHYVNYNTWYNEGHVFAYGIPSSSVPPNNEQDINGAWRYLGYTEGGDYFSNQTFLDDYSSGIIPENWHYITMSGAQSLWTSLISAQYLYMKNENLIGHGATSLYVGKSSPSIGDVNIGESKALIQSSASWYDGSSIRIDHYYSTNPSLIYYATFSQPPTGGGDVEGLIEAQSIVDIGTLQYIDITVNSSAFIDKPSSEVADITVELDSISNSYVALTGGLSTSANSSSTSLNKTMRINRPAAFPYQITITGTATVNSIFGDYNTINLSKTISVIGVNDIEGPVISYDPNSVSWTNSDTDVTISVSDDVAVKLWRYRISSDNGSSWGSWSSDLTSASSVVTFSSTGIYKIDAYAEDNTGNSTTKTSGTYYIDKISPTITINPNSSGWSSDNISVSVNIADYESGLYRWQYRTSINGGSSWGSWSSYLTSGSTTLTFSNSGSNVIQIIAYDNAGNSSTKTSGTYYIDKSSPSSLVYNYESGGYKNGNNVYAKFGDIVGYSVNGIDAGAGIYRLFLLARDNSTDPYRGHYRSGAESNYNSHNKVEFQDSTAVINTNNDFKVAFPIKVVTQENNIVFDIEAIADDNSNPYNRTGWIDNGLRLIIDNENPVINSNTNAGVYSESKTVVITSYDLLSGFKDLEYAITGSTSLPSTWSTYSSSSLSLLIDQQGNNYIHIRSYDNVGNMQYNIYGNYNITYNQPPLINIGTTPGFIYQGDDVVINIDVGDSDLQDLLCELVITKDGSPYLSDSFTISPINGDYNIYNYTNALLNSIDRDSYSVTATITDTFGESDTDNINFNVNALIVTGSIFHTTAWNENRINYNQAHSGTDESPRDYDTYFAGERFILSANTTTIDSSRADLTAISVNCTIVGFTYSDSLTNTSGVIWDGDIWHKDMLSWDDRYLTFRFTATYSNGEVVQDYYNISVADDEYWRLHMIF